MTALETIIELVETHGFYRDEESGDFMGVTVWTCDEWADWWQSDANPRRCEVLLDVVAHIIGNESGWERIRCQPKAEA